MIKNLIKHKSLIFSLLQVKPQRSNTFKYNGINLNQIQIVETPGLLNTLRCQFGDFKQTENKNSYGHKRNKTASNKSQQSRKFQKIKPSQKQIKRQTEQNNKGFTYSLTSPELFMQHINNKNTIQDAVKLLNRIVNTKTITKQDFETNVWKKYTYYVYLVGQKEQQKWQAELLQKGDKKSELKQRKQGENEDVSAVKQNLQETHNQDKEQLQVNGMRDNHKIARVQKQKRLRIKFLSLISQVHQKFNGQLTAQNITKTLNKFCDFYLQKQQWSSLSFGQRLCLIESISRYNVKKAKTIFLKRRGNLFEQKRGSVQRDFPLYSCEDLTKLLSITTNLQINDTPLFQKCIDLLYDQINKMNLMGLEQITYLLGKSHKFVNKDFLLRIKDRFNQLINQFNDSEIVRVLHIVSSITMIQKNMQLNSVYLQPLDGVYERIFPFLNSVRMSTYKSRNLSTIASALRRCQFYEQSVLTNLIAQSIKRQVAQFARQHQKQIRPTSNLNEYNSINVLQLTQIFFALATFNHRNKQFMHYFLNLLKVIQTSSNPQKYMSYSLFSRLLWSMCVLCNQQEISQLLPLMQHFYKKSRQIQPHDATNFYYCYLLMKRKYLVSQIRFDNDKIQQYLSGPKHEIQISQTQRQVHKLLLQLGIPSLLEYNLNNVICDIYIPKFSNIEHLIVQVHGYHHFARNLKKLNGSTILKQKIIQSEGYNCFYISLDEWLIAEDKLQFVKVFMNQIVKKKYSQKLKKRQLEESTRNVQRIEKRGRRVLQFKKRKTQIDNQIQTQQEQLLPLDKNEQSKQIMHEVDPNKERE